MPRPGLLHSSTLLRVASAVLGLSIFSGCAIFQPAGPPKQVSLRFYFATPKEQEGYRLIADEAGQPLYIAPTPLLTEADVDNASVWNSSQRSLVLLEFAPQAAYELQRATAAHVGGRLAIFIDDQLVASPTIRQAFDKGKAYVNGEFSRARAEEIARGVTVRTPVGGPP